VIARLAESSQTVVAIVFLVMNLDQLLAVPFLRLLEELFSELIEAKNSILRSSSEAANECSPVMA